MKKVILSVILLATAFSASQAALLTYNATGPVNTTPHAFEFNKFNSGLGTLSAIDLIINYSTPAGSATVTNNDVSNTVIISNIKSSLEIVANPALGFGGYTGSWLSLDTNPIAEDPVSFALAPNTSQGFIINSNQSLIGGIPQHFPISGGSFASYLGSGSVSFSGLSTIDLTATGSSYDVDSSHYYANTSLSLQYTYTPSPVPETGQVAASLLVVVGLGVYFLRRRRVQAAS